MGADPTIVADLNEVIDLRARTDHSIIARTTVDGRVGADVHIIADHDASKLGDRLQPLRPGMKPNPSCPIRTPGARRTRAPMIAWVTVTCGPIRQPGRSRLRPR